MADPTIAEVVPQVIAKETIPVSPAVGSAQEMAKTMRSRLEQGDWRASIDFLRKPLDRSKAAENIEEIGIEYSATTGRKIRSREVKGRYDRATTGEMLSRRFLEVGYDKLTPAEQDTLRGQIIDQAVRSSYLEAQIHGMSAAEQKAFAERYLKDSNFEKKILEARQAAESTKINVDKDALEDAVLRADEKELDRNDKQLDIGDAVKRLGAIDAKLADYKRDDATGAPLPTSVKATEIDMLQTALPTVQAELPLKRNDLRTAQRDVDDLTEEFRTSQVPGWTGRATNDIRTELVAARTKRDTVQDEVATREAQIQRLEQLKTEEQQWNEQRREVDKEKRDKELERDKLNLELTRAKGEVADLKKLRESQEENIALAYENIFANASGEMFKDQIDTVIKNYDEEIKKRKGESETKEEQGAWSALQERWLGPARERARGVPGFRRRETYRPINRQQIQTDFDTLMTDGPQQVLRNILEEANNPTTGTPLYTPAEIDALIGNKEFTDKMQPETIKQLLGRKLLTGGLGREDIHIITNAQWGKDMIAGAMQKNTEYKKAVENIMGEGALSSPGFFEKFAQEARNKPWLLSLLLLGIAGVVLAGPIGLAAAGVAPAVIGRGALTMEPQQEEIATT